MGHPTGSPKLHAAMTAKRRRKPPRLTEEIPVPEVHGDLEGEALLVGWGSTYGPIHEAINRARDRGEGLSALHLRHLHPLPSGLNEIFDRFKRVIVVGNERCGYAVTASWPRFCAPGSAIQKSGASPRPTD